MGKNFRSFLSHERKISRGRHLVTYRTLFGVFHPCLAKMHCNGHWELKRRALKPKQLSTVLSVKFYTLVQWMQQNFWKFIFWSKILVFMLQYCNLTPSVLLEILVCALTQFNVLVVRESFADRIDECGWYDLIISIFQWHTVFLWFTLWHTFIKSHCLNECTKCNVDNVAYICKTSISWLKGS